MQQVKLVHDRGRIPLWALLAVMTLLKVGSAQTPAPTQGAELMREFANSDDTDAFLRHARIRPQLQQLLGAELPHLEINLDVRGSVDVISGWLSVIGNAPHQGTEEEAVVCVSAYNLEVTAAILSDGIITAYARGATYDNLPRCITDWITQANSGHKDRFEQPQNVRMADVR